MEKRGEGPSSAYYSFLNTKILRQQEQRLYMQLGLFVSVYLSVPFPSPLLASVVCAAAPISPPSPISGPSLT